MGIEATIKQVPMGLNLGSGSTRDQVQQLCKQYDDWSSRNEQAVSLAISTGDKAIDAWRRCKELERSDVFFTVDPRAELVAFGVRRGTDIIDFQGMNYLDDHIVCTGPVGRNGSEVVIDTRTRFTLTESKETPITCRRKFIESPDGISYLPATEISISAQGAAPLIVPLPREERYEPSLASDIRVRLEESSAREAQLQQSLDEANGRIDAINTSLSLYIKYGASVYLANGGVFLRHWSGANAERSIITSGTRNSDTKWTVRK